MSVKVSATLLLLDCILVACTDDFYFRCNGLYGQISFDSRDDQKVIAKYKEAIKGSLPENVLVVDVRCCLFNSDFGLVFSSPVIESDYFWKCTHVPLGKQIGNSLVDGYDSLNWEDAQVIRNFLEDPTADIVYDKSQNNGLEKRFGANAKWIWATVNGSAPVYDHNNRLCVSCKGHTKDYVPREFFGWLASTSKEGLQLFGVNYRGFELVFELLPPSWNSSYCTRARVTMVISPGLSYLIAVFGVETDHVSQLWHCTSSEIDLRCIRLFEVSMHPLKCQLFNMVWIAIKPNGQFSLGVGRVLHRNIGVLAKLNSEYQTIKELRVDHASTQHQKDENHVAKLRVFRSLKDNCCIFNEDELHLLQPCGDGYIIDEEFCHECGCCFYPADLLGHHATKDYVTCYRPMFSRPHSVHETNQPSCFRSFRDVIGNVSIAVRPSGRIKLFQNITFVVAIQNLPPNVRVRLNFGDGLTEENIALAMNAQTADRTSFAYNDFYFGTIAHQYTHQAPSGLHDCLQKSCGGYFATLEIVGRGKDRLEVSLFVEGGNAPFEAQIFTRVESEKGNVTICAVVRNLEVPVSLVQASMELVGATVNVSLRDDLSLPFWCSNRSEPSDLAVILNHVFNTKDLVMIRLHLLLPNGVRYVVETQLAKSFQREIGLYDVITDADKKSSFNLYENITFLLRIKLTTDVVAALSFGDGNVLQNIKLSRSISLRDTPKWAAPFTQDPSLCKTFVTHQYTNPGRYTVRLEFAEVPNSIDTLFNETEVHVGSFVKSLGRVRLITNTSMTINPYDTVSFIILIENSVGNTMAVLKLDEDSSSLYARFARSSRVEYEGVWYSAMTATYSFYKPGRHNIMLTIKDGFNSSNLAQSVVTTEIVVNSVQDAIGEVGLYLDVSKLNFRNTDVEFCVLVQRLFRHMRLRASMGDGHAVDFIKVDLEQQAPLWMKLVPPKSFYLRGVFSHVYSSAGTYLVEIIAEDSLKSRPDYSTALIKVVVQDPSLDTVTVPVPTDNVGAGTSYSRLTDEQYTMEIIGAVEQSGSDGDSPGMDFTVTSQQDLDGSDWKRTDANKEYRSNIMDPTVARSDQLYSMTETDASQPSAVYSVDDHVSISSNIQFSQNEIDTDEASEVSTNTAAAHPNAATYISQPYTIGTITTDEIAGFSSTNTLPESGIDPDKTTGTSQPNSTMAAAVGEDYHSIITDDDVEALVFSTGPYKTTSDKKNILMSSDENGESQMSMNANYTVAPKYTAIVNGKYEDTVLQTSEDFIQTVAKSHSSLEVSTNELKQFTSGVGRDTFSIETDRRHPAITTFKSITPVLDTHLSAATPKTLTQDITELRSHFISKAETEFPAIRVGSGEHMLVQDTSRKPLETTLKDIDLGNISSAHVPNFHVTVYVDPVGVVSFLVLLETVTKKLRGKILFGDDTEVNFTFDQLTTSNVPDWLLERPTKDHNFQLAIRTHVYPDIKSTYEARITVYDDSGQGFRRGVIFKLQSCTETESMLTVNDMTSATCFQLHIKDTVYLNVHLPFCLPTMSTRSRWIVSEISTRENDTGFLVKDSLLSSPVSRDALNYTLLPYTLEAASYMIEVHVNSEDEFGTIVGLSKARACISLESTRLQAVAFASKQNYTIDETIIIDATLSRDPDQPLSSSGLELSWFCSTKNITKDTKIGGSTCFEDDRAVLGFSGATLTFPATQLIFTVLPANYFLTVLAMKPGRESASTTIQISLIVGNPPSCDISCLYNCEAHIDVQQLLLLQVSCSNCDRTERLSYLWRFVSPQSSNRLAGVSSREVLMEYDTARCAVKAGVFSMANSFEEYQIDVRVSRVDGTHSWTSYPIHINTTRALLEGQNLRFGKLESVQAQKETDRTGPLIAIIIGVSAAVIAIVGAVYLIKRYLARKASNSLKKTNEGDNEPAKQSTEADTSADTSA